MRYTLFLFLLAMAGSAHSQYAPTIRSGRPGQAIGPYTLGHSVVQIQSGINGGRATQGASTNTAFNTVVRVGIWERFELSGVFNWQRENLSVTGGGNTREGVNDTQLGGRINLTANRGWLPAICFQGRVLLLAQSEIYQRRELGSQFIIATTNSIGDRLGLTTNFGFGWDGNGNGPRYNYIINVAYGLNDQLSVFAEVFGNPEASEVFFDTGLAWLLNPDLQLDLAGGWRGGASGRERFLDVGASWRFDWRTPSRETGDQRP